MNINGYFAQVTAHRAAEELDRSNEILRRQAETVSARGDAVPAAADDQVPRPSGVAVVTSWLGKAFRRSVTRPAH